MESACVEQIFNASDANRDGYLDKFEFKTLVRNVNPETSLTDSQLDLILEEVWISYSSFLSPVGLSIDGLKQIYLEGHADAVRDCNILLAFISKQKEVVGTLREAAVGTKTKQPRLADASPPLLQQPTSPDLFAGLKTPLPPVKTETLQTLTLKNPLVFAIKVLKNEQIISGIQEKLAASLAEALPEGFTITLVSTIPTPTETAFGVMCSSSGLSASSTLNSKTSEKTEDEIIYLKTILQADPAQIFPQSLFGQVEVSIAVSSLTEIEQGVDDDGDEAWNRVRANVTSKTMAFASLASTGDELQPFAISVELGEESGRGRQLDIENEARKLVAKLQAALPDGSKGKIVHISRNTSSHNQGSKRSRAILTVAGLVPIKLANGKGTGRLREVRDQLKSSLLGAVSPATHACEEHDGASLMVLSHHLPFRTSARPCIGIKLRGSNFSTHNSVAILESVFVKRLEDQLPKGCAVVLLTGYAIDPPESGGDTAMVAVTLEGHNTNDLSSFLSHVKEIATAACKQLDAGVFNNASNGSKTETTVISVGLAYDIVLGDGVGNAGFSFGGPCFEWTDSNRVDAPGPGQGSVPQQHGLQLGAIAAEAIVAAGKPSRRPGSSRSMLGRVPSRRNAIATEEIKNQVSTPDSPGSQVFPPHEAPATPDSHAAIPLIVEPSIIYPNNNNSSGNPDVDETSNMMVSKKEELVGENAKPLTPWEVQRQLNHKEWKVTDAHVGQILAELQYKIEQNHPDVSGVQRAASRLPNWAKHAAHMEIGDKLLAHGMYQAALTSFQEAVAAFPEDPLARFRLGNAHFAVNQYVEACRSYYDSLQRCKEDDPLVVKIHINMGISLESDGRVQAAEREYAKAVLLDPTHPRAHKLLGSTRLALGDVNGAIASFSKALDINPNFADAWADMGCAHSVIGDYEQAMKCLEKAREIDPNHIEALFDSGNVARLMGNLELALQHYDKVLDLDAEHWRSWLHRAVVLSAMSAASNGGKAEHKTPRRTEAVAALNHALRLSQLQSANLKDDIEKLRKLMEGPGFHQLDVDALSEQLGEIEERLRSKSTMTPSYPRNTGVAAPNKTPQSNFRYSNADGKPNTVGNMSRTRTRSASTSPVRWGRQGRGTSASPTRQSRQFRSPNQSPVRKRSDAVVHIVDGDMNPKHRGKEASPFLPKAIFGGQHVDQLPINAYLQRNKPRRQGGLGLERSSNSKGSSDSLPQEFRYPRDVKVEDLSPEVLAKLQELGLDPVKTLEELDMPLLQCFHPLTGLTLEEIWEEARDLGMELASKRSSPSSSSLVLNGTPPASPMLGTSSSSSSNSTLNRSGSGKSLKSLSMRQMNSVQAEKEDRALRRSKLVPISTAVELVQRLVCSRVPPQVARFVEEALCVKVLTEYLDSDKTGMVDISIFLCVLCALVNAPESDRLNLSYRLMMWRTTERPGGKEDPVTRAALVEMLATLKVVFERSHKTSYITKRTSRPTDAQFVMFERFCADVRRFFVPYKGLAVLTNPRGSIE